MARTSLARRLGAASASTVLLLTAVACGGDSGDEPRSDAGSSDGGSASSSQSSEGSSSGGSSEDQGLEELSADEFYPTVMGALEDAETARFTMKSDSKAGGAAQSMTMTGSLKYDDDGIDMQAETTGAQAMQMIVEDGVYYLRGPMFELGGKQWLKVDPKAQPNSPLASLMGNTDPARFLSAMDDPKEFRLVGEEQVDGEPANHYRIVLDGAKVAKAAGLPPQMAQLLPPEVPTEMWVDAEDRPVRFRQTTDITVPTGNAQQKVSTTTEGTYSDFGVDVDIDTPDDSQVTTKMQLKGMPAQG